MSVPIVNRRFNDAASPSKDPWDADDMLDIAHVLFSLAPKQEGKGKTEEETLNTTAKVD